MEPYTIEDIELLRKKSGLSYQEAVALLDYHNGSLARALIDLEKSGRLKDETSEKEGTRNMNETGKKKMKIRLKDPFISHLRRIILCFTDKSRCDTISSIKGIICTGGITRHEQTGDP